MKKVILILSSVFLAKAQALAITGPGANVKAGSSFTVSVSIGGTASSGDQALQFTIPGLTWPVVATAGPAAVAAGKQLSCATVGTALNCIVSGLNSTLLGDGQVASLLVTLPKTLGAGTTSLALSALLAATTDISGNVNGGTVTAGTPFSLSTTSLCDLNSDGKVDTLDLGLIQQQALGVTACTTGDLNSDLKCNVQDVQIVANAAAGGACLAK